MVDFFACLAFCGFSMVLTALGLGLGRVSSCKSSRTVTTVSNLEMPCTVMVPTIALYHSGVEAVVSPVSFFISPSYVWFSFFLFLPFFNYRVLRPCLLISSSSSLILASMLRPFDFEILFCCVLFILAVQK